MSFFNKSVWKEYRQAIIIFIALLMIGMITQVLIYFSHRAQQKQQAVWDREASATVQKNKEYQDSLNASPYYSDSARQARQQADNLADAKTKDSLRRIEATAYEGIQFGMAPAQVRQVLRKINHHIGKYPLEFIPSYVDNKLYKLDIYGAQFDADYIKGYLNEELDYIADAVYSKYGPATHFYDRSDINDLEAGQIVYDYIWDVGDKHICVGIGQTYDATFHTAIIIYSDKLTNIHNAKEMDKKNRNTAAASSKF